MPKEDWAENTVQKIFEREGLFPTGRVKTVLDLGCGLSLKSKFIDAVVRVGLDVYRPFLERIESEVPYVAINADVMEVDRLFLPESFDLVMACDLVEHLDKQEALRVLDMAEKMARVAVIIETPKGFVPQNIDIWGHGGHEYQTHRSSWEPDEFEARGYKVVLRDYTMSDIKRHTEVDVDPHIVMIDAIRRFDGDEGEGRQ